MARAIDHLDHPVFKQLAARDSRNALRLDEASSSGLPGNLIAADGKAGIYIWDSSRRTLSYLSLSAYIKEQQSSSAQRENPLKQLLPEPAVDFEVRSLIANQTGDLLALLGDSSVAVVQVQQLPGLSRGSDVQLCRTHALGNGGALILQALWHPLSFHHLAVLTQDGAFRLFSAAEEKHGAEQEYLLSLPRGPEFAAVPQATTFSFGAPHLWELFTVFISTADGSLYALCPVVPFGGRVQDTAVETLQEDVGQGPSASAAAARAWLDAAFMHGAGGVLHARAYWPLHATLQLQGPLPTLDHKEDAARNICSLSSTLVGSNSVLATLSRDGFLHTRLLAGDIEPAWTHVRAPRVLLDGAGRLASVAMVVEALPRGDCERGRVGTRVESWSGMPPPLILHGEVDLALPPAAVEAGHLQLLNFRGEAESLLCCHAAGVDLVLIGVQGLEARALLDVRSASGPLQPLAGLAVLNDDLGEVHVLVVTSAGEALLARVQHGLPFALRVRPPDEIPEAAIRDEHDAPAVISQELLQGVKYVAPGLGAGAGHQVAASSVEGRALLHDGCKLLHEKYVEYCHRAYVELLAHGKRMQGAVAEMEDRHQRLHIVLQAELKAANALARSLQERQRMAKLLAQRTVRYSQLPQVSRRPLCRLEHTFRLELGELEQQQSVLQLSLEELEQRVQRVTSRKVVTPTPPAKIPPAQLRRLKGAVVELSQIVTTIMTAVHSAEASIEQQVLHLDS